MSTLALATSLLLLSTLAAAEVPRPLPGNPGRVFLADQAVVVPAVDGAWRLVDYDGTVQRAGAGDGEALDLGRLPVGWYELEHGGARRSLAVLAPPAVPTPADSPICIDTAMSWLYSPRTKINPPGAQREAASLAALTGVAMIRDRCTWGRLEPEPGTIDAGRLDRVLDAIEGTDLQLLMVYHDSPGWSRDGGSGQRFAQDLRHVHRFSRLMGETFRGRIQAWEPYNEPDIDRFGGHTGAEIAAWQKASYLGFKAGDPDLHVCMAVPSQHRETTLGDFAANRPFAYMDSTNIHHYHDVDRLPGIYDPHRRHGGGLPFWVTEADVFVPVCETSNELDLEPAAHLLRRQAQSVARIYAWSIHEGCERVFYFILPNYSEGHGQSGVLRRDLSPRPSYSAVAAAGRLLAGARSLGALTTEDGGQGVLLDARPDGERREVLVAWNLHGESRLTLPRAPLAAYDLLGRELPVAASYVLDQSPIFLCFAPGAAADFELSPPPQIPRVAAERSPIVLQPTYDRAGIDLEASTYLIDPVDHTLTIFVYHFGDSAAELRLTASADAGCTVTVPAQLSLAPGERAELPLRIRLHHGAGQRRVTVRAEAPGLPPSVLSLMVDPRRSERE